MASSSRRQQQQSLRLAIILLLATILAFLTTGNQLIEASSAQSNSNPTKQSLELVLANAFGWPQSGSRVANDKIERHSSPLEANKGGGGGGNGGWQADGDTGGFIPRPEVRHSWPMGDPRLQNSASVLMGQLDALEQLNAIGSLLDESDGSSRLGRAYKPRIISTARGFGKRSSGSARSRFVLS